MNIETERERIFQGRDSLGAEKLTVHSEGEEWTDSASGEEPMTQGDHPRTVSVVCSGYNEGFPLAETGRHFSVMCHEVLSSGEFQSCFSLRRMAAQGRGFVKIQFLSCSQNGVWVSLDGSQPHQ